jgi:hypothetical protein
MSLHNRVRKLVEVMGVGKLFDGIDTVQFLKTYPFGPREKQPADIPDGARRCRLMMAVVSGLYEFMKPELLRLEREKPTEWGRAQHKRKLIEAKKGARKLAESIGVELRASSDEVIEALLGHCKDAGFTAPELAETRKHLEGSRRTWRRNAETQFF